VGLSPGLPAVAFLREETCEPCATTIDARTVEGVRWAMPTMIVAESPDTADARTLIAELDAYLIPLYPIEDHYGYSIQKLLEEAVAFFVMRHDGIAAGCGGIKLFGTAYGRFWLAHTAGLELVTLDYKSK
jgi:hypothetical protein